MSKTLLKIDAYINRFGHQFSKGPLKPANIIVVVATQQSSHEEQENYQRKK